MKDHETRQYEMVQFPSDKKTVVYKKHQDAEEGSHKFTFDQTFPMESTQEEVFESVKDIIGGLFDGFNGTIFAYGQTGSGKTHTMMGPDELNSENQGLIPRITEMIFDEIQTSSEDIEFMIKVSMVEIYMEKIKDLLAPTKDNLKIHEDKEKGVYIADCTEIYVSDESDVGTIMMRGNQNRAVSATNMNERSSRSHTIFIITIKQTNKTEGSCKSGKLYLVDLAGSEKLSKTGAKGHVFQEAITINKSLTTLGIVINKLTDGVSKYVPYRDSKLTRVLQQSLGGNAKTCLIITCSPSSFNSPETLSTLRFGFRAKSIKNKPKVNKEYTVAELRQMLSSAEKRIESLIKRNVTLEKAVRQMGGDVDALYGNADGIIEDEEEEEEENILDVTSPDIIADLSAIMDDPFNVPSEPEEGGYEEDEKPLVLRNDEKELVIKKRWELNTGTIKEEEEGGDEEDQNKESQAVKIPFPVSPIHEVKEATVFKSNQQPATQLDSEIASLDDRLRIWEKRCQEFEKQLERAKLIKEKEISRLMDRISKERERSAKYRKKASEVQKDASKKGATLLLLTDQNQKLVKRTALLKLQNDQNQELLKSKETRLKQLSAVNQTLMNEIKLLKDKSNNFAFTSKIQSPASPSSAGPLKADTQLIEFIRKVVSESLIPPYLEPKIKEVVGKDVTVKHISEGLDELLTNEKIKLQKSQKFKEKEYYLGKIKRRDEKIKELMKQVNAKNMQVYELKAVIEQNGNPLQDKLYTLEKNLEHLTSLYYSLVSQKSTLQLEKNILEKKLKRSEKLVQEKTQEYKNAFELAEHRKMKLEKLLRKLNRGLEDHEQYMMTVQDQQRESVIGDDVVKNGKIAKPIKGGGRYPRSNSEYLSSTLLKNSNLKSLQQVEEEQH